MQRYRWQAMDAAGKTHKGDMEASSLPQVRKQLREQGLIALSVTPVAPLSAMLKTDRARAIPQAARTLFTRQLATLVNAAIPLENALRVIAGQSENPRLAKLVAQLKEKVTEGYALHEALSAWPKVFDKLFCTLGMAGEKTGRLGDVLEKLADHNEQQQNLRNKLTQAMIYPAALTVVATGVICILLTAVVPQVIEQFVHMKQALPMTTQILLAVSNAVQRCWAGFLLLLAVSTILFRLWLKKSDNLLRFHRWQVRYSPCRKLVKAVGAARYIRTLTILQSSHVPLLEAMDIARAVNANLYINTLMAEAADKVRQGMPLCTSLEQTQIFPVMMIYMISSGEQSGELSTLMGRAAENQEKTLQHRITLMLAIFEPVLVITMASVVLFIVLSILQPILQLNNLVS